MIVALITRAGDESSVRSWAGSFSVQHEPSSPHQIQQWLEDARHGSTDALGRLLEASRPYLLRIADDEQDLRLRSKGDGADLVQQTFLEASRDFPQFQGTTDAELLAWLRQILRHKLANLRRWFHTRKHDVARESPFSDTTSLAAPTEQLPDCDQPSGNGSVAGEQAAVIERILAHLPEDYRRVIVLHIREERSFAEIAATLGRSSDAVRKLLFRALEKARQYLER